MQVDDAKRLKVLDAENAKLKKLLERIRDHEIYHVDVFSDLLKEVDK